EFCSTIRLKEKADLIDGVIYMASPDNTDADDLGLWLIRLLGDFLEISGFGGRLFGSRVAFRLGKNRGPEPDISYVRQGRLHLVRRGYVAGRPDVAIEIVSPDSFERDYVLKHALYEEAKIPEYWIIDEAARKLTVLRLDARGKYREVRTV